MNGIRTLVALTILAGILLVAETHWRPAVAQEKDKAGEDVIQRSSAGRISAGL